LQAQKPPTGLVHQYAERPEVGRLRHALLDRLCVSSVGVHKDRLATEILELSATCVPYDPSFETPDGRGPDGRLMSGSIPVRVNPAEYSWCF
jgi:hypothetical protein